MVSSKLSNRFSRGQLAGGIIAGAIIGSMIGTIGLSFADNNYATSNVTNQLVIPYDGYLSLNSTPVNSAARKMRFVLYESASGGVAQWREEQDVAIYNGRFSAAIGSGTALAPDPMNNPNIQPFRDIILDAQKLYLAIEVEDTPGTFVPLSGRQAIEAAPYAAWSANASSFSVANDLTVQRNIDVSGSGVVGGNLDVNGATKLGDSFSGDSTRVRGGDNDGATAALSVESSSSQLLLLDGNEIDATKGDLYLQNNTNNAILLQSETFASDALSVGGNLTANRYAGGIRPLYSSWTPSNTGEGGAAIVNDSGTYKALMIVGNNSNGSTVRKVNLYDDLHVDDDIYAGDDLHVTDDATINGNLTVGGTISGIGIGTTSCSTHHNGCQRAGPNSGGNNQLVYLDRHNSVSCPSNTVITDINVDNSGCAPNHVRVVRTCCSLRLIDN